MFNRFIYQRRYFCIFSYIKPRCLHTRSLSNQIEHFGNHTNAIRRILLPAREQCKPLVIRRNQRFHFVQQRLCDVFLVFQARFQRNIPFGLIDPGKISAKNIAHTFGLYGPYEIIPLASDFVLILVQPLRVFFSLRKGRPALCQGFCFKPCLAYVGRFFR